MSYIRTRVGAHTGLYSQISSPLVGPPGFRFGLNLHLGPRRCSIPDTLLLLLLFSLQRFDLGNKGPYMLPNSFCLIHKKCGFNTSSHEILHRSLS